MAEIVTNTHVTDTHGTDTHGTPELTEPTQTVLNNDKGKDPDQIYDKCKQVVVFHNHLCSFFRKLKVTFPELKKPVTRAIKTYKEMSRCDYLKELHKQLTMHINKISEYDEGIFSDDYREGPLELLLKLDFKQIWAVIDSDDFAAPDAAEGTKGPTDDEFKSQTKYHIFDSIQAIYICSEIALSQISDFDKALSNQKEFLMNMLGNLNLNDKLKERVEQLAAEENQGTGSNFESLEKLGELFGEDNFIYQLAKDVADEVNLGGDGASPVEALAALFANDGKKMQELIITVGNKLEEKVKKGEITEEQLIADAEKMRTKIQDTVGNIPGLSDMMGQSNITGQFRTQYENLSPEEQERFQDIIPILDKDMLQWNKKEKQLFDEFAKFTLDKNSPGSNAPDPDAPGSDALGSNASATK